MTNSKLQWIAMKKAVLLAAAFISAIGVLAGQNPAESGPEEMADALLAKARKAYDDKQLAPAASSFREFAAKFPQHHDQHVLVQPALVQVVEKRVQTSVERREHRFHAIKDVAIGTGMVVPVAGPQRDELLGARSSSDVPGNHLKNYYLPPNP